MNETFDELERKAYISNLTDVAKIYAKLDDAEYALEGVEDCGYVRDLEYKIETLEEDVHDLEIQVGVWKDRYNTIKDKVEKI